MPPLVSMASRSGRRAVNLSCHNELRVATAVANRRAWSAKHKVDAALPRLY